MVRTSRNHPELQGTAFARHGTLIVALFAMTFANVAFAGNDSTSFAPVVKQVAPSVVTISTTKTVERSQQFPPFFDFSPDLRRFFGFDERLNHETHVEKQQGLGSGVIVTSSGYILTNNHVIVGADGIKVGLSNSHEQYNAKVIGADPHTDVAVLKIEVDKDLPVIAMGDSDQIEVGDIAIAIGNPFGIGQTVTMGIISARGRGIGLTDYEDYIQTDASINPGNSGGALVDAHGKLIGINTAILSPTGGNLGIGFAIPINLARSTMDSLISNGKVARGYLGLVIQPITEDMAKEFKLSNDNGALVSDVLDGGPAAKSGVKAGDVIVGLNETHIADPRQLRLVAAQKTPGTKVSLTVVRDGKKQKLDVTLQDMPTSAAAENQRGRNQEVNPEKWGLSLGELTEQARAQFGVPREIVGALITGVMPGSNAAAAGIKAGEVVLEVQRKAVSSLREAVGALELATGNMVLYLWSPEGKRFVVVDRK